MHDKKNGKLIFHNIITKKIFLKKKNLHFILTTVRVY